MLKLMYITNDPEVAVIAENAGVDRVFIDMEYIGKNIRQGGMDHIFDKKRLANIKNGAVIVNISRGGVIDTEALIEALHTFLYLSFNILFLAVIKIGVYGYLLAMNLSNLGAILFLVISCKLYKNFISIKRINWKLAKDMIKYSLPMIPNYISWWFNNCSDRYMVSFFCGTSVTGIYSVAYKIPTILSSMTSIFSSAWKISSVENFGSDESVKFYNKTYQFYSGLLLIGGSILIFLTKFLASFLFAKKFFLAWRITPFLILAYIISALALRFSSSFWM